MSSNHSVISPSRPEGTKTTVQQGAGSGGTAGIEIVGFPQILYTRSFGDPDILFVPLLDAAREAHTMLERLSGHGEPRADAVRLSGMQLASSLLREPSFSLAARGQAQEHTYTVDLDKGILHMNTRLYAIVSRRTSSFRVEIVGKIAGGTFGVRNPVKDSIIMQVSEERLRQPNVFSSSLAQECLREQLEQERNGRLDESLGPVPSRCVRKKAGNPGTLSTGARRSGWARCRRKSREV